ncbi:FtsK/SpoIIIE domain-containing protein [Nocardia sp.]|uniref:FtsK/SpoIIIE domain-containing protein n=1 Tax=Nocardia sp. TaxID=1821 RepID=UPI00262055A5|nr:FtsK/SpoIIIE domain-containing protein [Nocardia sp.]
MVGALLVSALAATVALACLRGPRSQSLAQIIAAAPIELRCAVRNLADNGVRNRMLVTLNLAAVDRGFPRLEWWDYTNQGLEAELTLVGGQSTKDWTDKETLDAMAHSLKAPKVTAFSPEPSRIRLEVRTSDVLAAPATLPVAVPDDVDLRAVRIGITEAGSPWLLAILWTHLLIVGATGSGKGGVLWAILHGLGPAIRSGLVDVWCVDPKGGVEFGPGKELFVRFAYKTAEDVLALLTEAVAVMRERQAALFAAGIRKHVPTVAEPLIVIIIDEAASLTAYASRKIREEFEELHGLLLSQGRALGISLIGCVQDPSKDTMPQRQLYPLRIGLRLDEPSQMNMVFGAGARDRGARCDEIPDTTPGVAFVEQDGSTSITRARAFLVTDDDVQDIVGRYAPVPSPIAINPHTTDSGQEVAA